MSKKRVIVSILALFVMMIGVLPISAQSSRNSRKADSKNAPATKAADPKAKGSKESGGLGILNRKKEKGGDAKQTDAGKNAPAASQVTSGGATATKPVKKSDGSEFNIPANATPKELLEAANNLMNTERDFETQDDYKAWVDKMILTVSGIADKLLTMDVDDETYVKATELKGEMIYYQGTSDPKAFETYEKFVRSLPNDSRLLKAEGGEKVADGQLASLLHWGCTRTVQMNGSVDDLKKYVGEFQELVFKNPDYVTMIPDLVYPVSEFAVSKKDPKLLKEVFFPFSSAMKKSDNKTLKDAAAGLEGIMRFAELKGKPFQIVGTTTEGEKFDQSVLKGKVYLMNFWATWVTPCVAMYPDLLALAVQYQDEGFTIVGYSLDDDLDKLKDYVETKKMPWVNLSEKMSSENKQPSLSEFYGITTIPTLILVGSDGTVLETDLDIDQLKVKLEEIFSEKKK